MSYLLGIFTAAIFSLVAIESALQVSFFTGFRQLTILFIFFAVWLGRRGSIVVPKHYLVSVMLIVSILITGAIQTGVPAKNVAIGTFMTIEFAIIFLLASSTKLTFRDITTYIHLLISFFFINALFVVLNYIDKFPAAMREDVGVQGDAGFFASGMNMGLILLLALHLWRSKAIYVVIAAAFSLVVFLTVIKKAIIVNFIIWLVWAAIGRSSKIVGRLIFITCIFGLATGLGIAALLENFDENINYLSAVGVEEHVRLIMYFSALDIAVDHFPLGSGAGSFGSLASITDYFSPLYDEYGVSVAPTNSREAVANGTHTLLDTYWPHILGEGGIIGLILLLSVFLMPFLHAASAFRRFSLPPELKLCAFITLCIPLSLFIEGFALYTTEAPSFIILLGGLSGYCYRVFMTAVKQYDTRYSNSYSKIGNNYKIEGTSA